MPLATGDSNDNKPAVGIEEEEVAKMGCPSLGEHTKLEVVIEESYEFKVTAKYIVCRIILYIRPWICTCA